MKAKRPHRLLPGLLHSFKAHGESATAMFALLGRLHDVSGNATWAWAAYRLARQNAVPPPAWVTAYLDGVASRIVELAGDRPKEWRRALAEALLFRRPPASAARDENDLLLADESRYEDGLEMKGADVVAGRRKRSRATVYRARTRITHNRL